MTNEQKLEWLKIYLQNCLGEELSNTQDIYTFGISKISDSEVLEKTPTIVLNGRVINTLQLSMILDACEPIEVLTNASFGIMCSNNPILKDWYLWNIERGRIAL